MGPADDKEIEHAFQSLEHASSNLETGTEPAYSQQQVFPICNYEVDMEVSQLLDYEFALLVCPTPLIFTD